MGDGPGGKSSAYAAFGNTLLLRTVEDHLPPGGAVLDVGCASGGLLAALAGRAGRREGIEPDPVAASAASEHADRIHVTDAAGALEVDGGAFDVVVLGDVLEHVVDPAATLRRAARWAREGGALVISLPNVAHWTVRSALLRGRWDYEPTGILDDTHLRFFTWRSGLDLVVGAGFEVVDRRPALPALRNFTRRPVPSTVERAWHHVGRLRPNLFAYLQVIVARPGPPGVVENR